MENAADALKMAADVLIFVIAVSISISTFSEARQTSQTILEYTDKTNDYVMWTEDEKNGYIDVEKKSIKVTADEIYPTISRAFFDNYRIIFTGFSDNNVLFKTKDINNTDIEHCSIDLESDELKKISDYECKKSFLIGIMYGKWAANTLPYDSNWFEKNNLYFTDNGISGIIGSNKVTQQVGMYYKEDEGSVSDDSTDNYVPEANKTKKRVITYTNT